MNPFEKIFNYRILSRLDGSGTPLITSHERAWLKTMLEHPAAREAFEADTLDKLRSALVEDDIMDTANHLTEKARSKESHVYHPLLRQLRRCIASKSGIRLAYTIKNGREVADQSGFPYKLEYSMVKREWYLLWYHLRHRAFMSTRLQKILSAAEEPLPSSADPDRILNRLNRTLDSRKQEACIEVLRQYNKELSRILYAFSCFEKDVAYDPDKDTYRVRVHYLGDDSEYLLSKIRFLGKRVRVVEGDYIRSRMLESSTKALARYGEDLSVKEPDDPGDATV
jgi:predicted DNA-binding transcriptional regulator YafY